MKIKSSYWPLCVIICDAHAACIQFKEGRNMYTNDENLVGELVLHVWVECSEITRDEIINYTLESQYSQKKLVFEHYSLHSREGGQYE